jgi:hypothetical protein
VLKAGYGEKSFFPGPLVRAMREGAVLFINELNRMPEPVQNVLLPALDEGLLILPRIGEITAAPGFQVVATQNPVEYIATGHLSEARKDRFEHIPLLHQSEPEEREIVHRDTGSTDDALIADAVAIARLTRSHPRFRKGASVRAAAGIVSIAEKLAAHDHGRTPEERLRAAALTAQATRVELRDEEDADLGAGAAARARAVLLGGRAGRRRALRGCARPPGQCAEDPRGCPHWLDGRREPLGHLGGAARQGASGAGAPHRGPGRAAHGARAGRPHPARTQVVLMMDTSLSMSGKNLALAAVAAGSSSAGTTRAGSGCSSPPACSPPATTRCRRRSCSRAFSCCSPRTTSWTRTCAPAWPGRGSVVRVGGYADLPKTMLRVVTRLLR